MGSLDLGFQQSPVELIFLGTGTSSTIPHVDCLTAPPSSKPCRTCLSTLTPEGKKNIRRNTSAVVKLRGRNSEDVTIVIDVGKSFQPAAVEWFPKHGLRRIDAVLITHAHADAMNGLDDLRGWTLHGAIQPYIDVYVSMSTFKEVQRAFPYLVSKQYASGGGDVGSLTGLFHAMTDVTLRRSLNSNGTSSKIACHSKSVILGFRSLHSQFTTAAYSPLHLRLGISQ